MFNLSIPGSLMLFGEHAVLHGKMGLVTAINARLQIKLIPNNSNKIIIYYYNFNNINKQKKICILNLTDLNTQLLVNKNNKDLIYVLESIKYINSNNKILIGFDLDLTEGNLTSAVGFGSSAAVVVGVLCIINRFMASQRSNNQLKLNKNQIFKQAITIIHNLQGGIGSGGDIAASIYGGIIAYQNYTIYKIINKKINLVSVYCGYKKATKEVIKLINNKINLNPNYKKLVNYIFDNLDLCSRLAIDLLEQEDFQILGNLMNIAHGLMTGLGVVDNKLDKIAQQLRSQPEVYGSKISGSGLGDCVIGLGEIKNFLPQEKMFKLTTDNEGIIWQ